jgi:hypothetical protein
MAYLALLSTYNAFFRFHSAIDVPFLWDVFFLPAAFNGLEALAAWLSPYFTSASVTKD